MKPYLASALSLLLLAPGLARADYYRHRPYRYHEHRYHDRDDTGWNFRIGAAFAGPVDDRAGTDFLDDGGFGVEGGLSYRMAPGAELGVGSGFYSIKQTDFALYPSGNYTYFDDRPGVLANASAVVPLTAQLTFNLLPGSPLRLNALLGGGVYWVRRDFEVQPVPGQVPYPTRTHEWLTRGGVNLGLGIESASAGVSPGVNARLHVIDSDRPDERRSTLLTMAATVSFR